MFSWSVIDCIVLAVFLICQLWRRVISDVIAAWLTAAIARDLPSLSPEALRELPDVIRALRSRRSG